MGDKGGEAVGGEGREAFVIDWDGGQNQRSVSDDDANLRVLIGQRG